MQMLQDGDVGEVCQVDIVEKVGNKGKVAELGMVGTLGDEIPMFLHLQAREVSVRIVFS